MSDKWHGGKGDKPRISDYESYSYNYERAFRKMTWRYWAKYDGLDYDKILFNQTGLDENTKITYQEFQERLMNEK